jgi:hypothetical protein
MMSIILQTYMSAPQKRVQQNVNIIMYINDLWSLNTF